MFSHELMFSKQERRFRQEAKPSAYRRVRGKWRLKRPDDKVIRRITAAMCEAGYGQDDIFAVRLAVEEAIVNAYVHGHHEDPAKTITVHYDVGPRVAVVSVEDTGPGFDPRDVPDPTLPENLDKVHGRGVMLMRKFMTSVRFSGRGNCVTLCKSRTQ